MKAIVGVMLMVLVPAVAHGTTLATLSLADLLLNADHVAVVEVMGRRVLADDCGAISRGRVVHALKGAQAACAGSPVEVTFVPGRCSPR